ncbi:hypothetical protein [Candidatus Palauibacter sp.]|uniref:hypothetical protein n=1 Tax=Candidatus Palauibacter sp. TaxID=3101350 RepID=UPI003B5BD4CE
MGLDVIGILSILVAVVGVGGTMGGLALRGIGNLKKDLTKQTDRLSGQLESVQKELRGELKSEITGLRGELKGDIAGLRDRIDAVHSEMVEARVAMSDRVARLEGSVFGMPLPDTGTDPA